MGSSFEKMLQQYARLAVRAGVNVQPGQEVIIGADVSEAAFVRLVAEEAYRAGAKNVFTAYSDEAGSLIRFDHGSPEAIAYSAQWFSDAVAEQLARGAGYLRVFGSDPALLRRIDPEKVAISSKAQAKASAKFMEVMTSMKSNFSIVAHASPAWAKAVFPNDDPDAAVSKLWDAIFSCTFADAPDPVGAWLKHCSEIESRRDEMTAHHYAALHFKGPGTDLRVGLADGHVWAGGRLTGTDRSTCSPNIPTEEVFTMPHRDRVDGFVRSTKPLSLRGSIVDGIEMVFENGVVTQARAAKGENILLGLLDTDEGARRLGEVALVPQSSRVSKANLLFFNTLFDENAASHIALGQALGENLEGHSDLSLEERMSMGMNSSSIHIDWMIGSGDIDVDGIKQDGSAEPLMRAGEWVPSLVTC